MGDVLTMILGNAELLLVSWLAALHAGLYTYGTIFVSMMVVALVMPEEPALLAWGLAVGAWQAQPSLACLAAIAGVLTTDAVLYALGRFGGRRLLFRLRLSAWLSENRRKAIERGFRQAGAAWLITARLVPIPGLRTGVFVSAGLLHYPWWRFLLCDAIFLALVGGILILGGYYYADAMGRWLQGFDTLRYWLALLAALVVGGLGLAYVSAWLGRKISGAVDNEPVPSQASDQTAQSPRTGPILPKPADAQTSSNGQHGNASETAQPPGSSRVPTIHQP
jgi:membrane protein DedA with SNARE-associated domain